MRMKSSTHHLPVMLTLCGLQRHLRRGAREFRAAEHRQSRPEGNAVTPHGCICVMPCIEGLTTRCYRGVSRPVPTMLIDIKNGTGSRSPDARYR